MRRTFIAIMLVGTASLSFGQEFGQPTQRQVLRPQREQLQVVDQPFEPPQLVPMQAVQTQVQVIPGQPGQTKLAYFSPRLGGRFVLQQIQIGNFAPVTAARIVSDPNLNSPLSKIGLKIGDVITRLDGIPISNYRQLEQHIYDTKVRFVTAGDSTVQSKTTWIRPNQYFQETFYAPDPPTVCPTVPSPPVLRP